MPQTKRKGNEFEIVTRAIIFNRNKILLCRIKGESYYFFPGGHVELKEFSEETLKREIREEIGTMTKNIKFIGLMENIWGDRHEMNLVFAANIDKTSVKALEDYMEFQWIEISSLKKTEIMPKILKKAVLKWTKDKKVFWVAERR